MPLNPLLIVAAAWVVGFGFAAGRLAYRQDRRVLPWLIIGALVGPAGLLFLAFAPPAYCRSCGTPTHGFGAICWWCHEDVRSRPPAVVAIDARMAGRFDKVAGTAPEARKPAAAPFAMPVAKTQTAAKTRTPARGADLADRRASVAVPDVRPKARPPAIARPASAEEVPGLPPFLAATERASTDRDAIPDTNRRDRPAAPTTPVIAEEAPRVLATAVFVAGSATLTPGDRYGLAIRGGRFLVLGPIDVDPSAVALDQPLARLDVHSVEGRLIVGDTASRSGVALAFMAGPSTATLAATIAEAAATARDA